MAHVLGSLFSPDCLLIIVCSAPKVNRFAQILRNCLLPDVSARLCLCVFFHAPLLLLYPSFFAVCPPFCSALSPCVFFHARCSVSAPLLLRLSFFAVCCRCSTPCFVSFFAAWFSLCAVSSGRLSAVSAWRFLRFAFSCSSPRLSRLGFADCRRSHFFFARFACSLFHALISSRRVLNLPSTPSSVGW